MSKAKNTAVLITCAGGSGPMYLARALRKKYSVVLADAAEVHAGRYLGLPCYRIPFGRDKRFIPAIERIVRKHRIAYIVPGSNEELPALISLKKKYPALTIVAPQRAFVELCLDKKKLMQSLDVRGISHVSLYQSMRAVRYPCVVKPVDGEGSRAVHRVRNAKELKGYLALYGVRFRDVLVQPYVGGDEYTVSVIVNNRNALIGVVPKKIILKRGITRAATTQRNRVIERVCKKIVRTFTPCGPFNVQLKLYRGRVFIFEINPRLSTTSVLTDRAFGNEVELFIRHMDETSVSRVPMMKESVLLVRYEENVFA